ncbi:11246_t:CDS:10, partial [Dentiscutata heterogama]
MENHNLSVNIHMLNSEQRRQLFLALIDADPTLPNVLNSERRHRLYAVLVAIDPTLAQPLLDSRSAVHGIINEQFPKGFTMNPIKIKEYEDYKDTQKRNKNELQWYEFLNLDKKQYLNFRNNLQNRAASRFLRGEPLSRQPKGKAKEVIKEFNKANPTFPVSEADFILPQSGKSSKPCLASYCNSMVDQEKKKQIANAKAKGYALPPPKKNVRPPARKRNTNHTQIESVLDQDSVDEMTDHTRDSDTSTLVTNTQKDINQAKKKKIAESMSNQEDTHEMTDHTQDSVTSNLEYNIPREDYDIENTDQDSIVSDNSNILMPATNIRSLFKKGKSIQSPIQNITNNDSDNAQDSNTSINAIPLPIKAGKSARSPTQNITNNDNDNDNAQNPPAINTISLPKKTRKNVQPSTNNDNDNSQDTLPPVINTLLPKKARKNVQPSTNNDNDNSHDTLPPAINTLLPKK